MNDNNTQTPENILAEEKQINLEKLATDNMLINVVAGSHAYGTNIEGSDWDERSIFTDSITNVVLPFEKIEQVQYREDDKVSFELSKYMPLLLQQNPNVIELIWTDEKDVLFKNEAGGILIDNRKNFLSIKVKDSYAGYAMAQLKRIKGHNKWINNPQPVREPEQRDFCSVIWNFTNNKQYNKTVPIDGYIAISIGDNTYSLWESRKLGLDPNISWFDKRGNPKIIEKNEFDKINTNNISPDAIVKINFDLFDSHHTNWKMYWNWKKNRNEKRSALEDKHGYDVKHAMHLIRLLRSGLDILKYGVVPVKREDFQYLLDIRFGQYTYEEIVKESENLHSQIHEISKKSNLPSEPNKDLAKEIMLNIYMKQWNVSRNDLNTIQKYKIS